MKETDFELLHKVEESGVTTRWLYIEDEQAKERLSKEDWDLAFVGGWEADGRVTTAESYLISSTLV